MVEQARPMAVTVASGSYNQYPAPMAKYEDVVADRQLFMTSLEKLHSVMGTKFMIPIIGGKDLDLHKLFVEVTSRGGIEEILREKRWKEVTTTFNFPSTATNASFVLRKYYYSLLQNYEKIYFFKVQGCGPSSTGGLQISNAAPNAFHGLPRTPPASSQAPSVTIAEPPRINSVDLGSGATASSVGTPVIGVIDGKFEGGYLVTVKIGKETLKGVMYHAPPTNVEVPWPTNLSTDVTNTTPTSGMSRKRKRRKKSELRKRDPSHPKPNRSGYNFFFSEQHARLKLLHPGKDREISRMIGELWNNLEDNEKTVYKEKAAKDKERYMMEMEDYREKLRGNEVISDAVPLRQRFPYFQVDMAGVDVNEGTQTNFSAIPGTDSDSSKSETEEDDDTIPGKDDESFSDTETSLPVGFESGNAGDFQIVQEDERPFEENEVNFEDDGHDHGETKPASPPQV